MAWYLQICARLYSYTTVTLILVSTTWFLYMMLSRTILQNLNRVLAHVYAQTPVQGLIDSVNIPVMNLDENVFFKG
jgi:hypothetical protein